MPLAAFRFRVLFSTDPDRHITRNLKSCSIDYTNELIELVVTQPEENAGINGVIRDLKSGSSITIEYMKSGGGEVGYSETMRVKMISHKLELGYNIHDIAKHSITLKILS